MAPPPYQSPMAVRRGANREAAVPDYFSERDDQPRGGGPTPAEVMAQHRGGDHPDGCAGGKCEAWRDAHVADVMSEFWTHNPTAARAVGREL